MFVEIDGLKINYIDEGAGNTILLLHGWGSSLKTWQPIINAFKDTNRVVALDFPGCGESDILKTPWTLEDYCDFTLKFIDALKIENPIVLGHSNGGRITIKLTAEERISPPKIVLIDSAGVKPKKSLKKIVKIYTFKTVKRIFSLKIFGERSEFLIKKARNYFGSSDYRSAPEVMRKTLVNLVNTDLTPVLKDIPVPTLLIWGDNDNDTPLRDAKIMEKNIRDAGLCVLSGTGHFSFLQKPFEAIAILKSFIG